MVVALIAGATVMSTLTVSDAWALRRLDCAGHTDYFTTYSVTGNTCWADNGYTSVTLLKVSQVRAGNNSGIYVASSMSYSFSSYQRRDHDSYPTLTYIDITGR